MSEKEIREIIRSVCGNLDRLALQGIRRVVLPAALGAGLALAPPAT